MNKSLGLAALILALSLFSQGPSADAKELSYSKSTPPLEVTFQIEGGHYSGEVTGGNLFLQTDISQAPCVRWTKANKKKLYTLLMLDFDGNANGSWPDEVPPGENSPVRHWIVGNIPGAQLAGKGYIEKSGIAADVAPSKTGGLAVCQPYRYPHIPVVSDRYGLYIFEQSGALEFAAVPDPITNFDHNAFLKKYKFADPVASNYFMAVYTSESPFSGKAFTGNDVSKTWHKDLGKGKLGRE